MNNNFIYLIIGAGTAGHFAAESIRKHDKSGSIAIIGDELHHPYHRPPLSKGVLTGRIDPLATFLKEDSFYSENNIEIRKGLAVTKIHKGSKKIELADGSLLGYEKLLLATGGRARFMDLPGNDLEGVHTLRTIDDSQQIMVAGQSAKHPVIIGGGFISAEVATSFLSLGIKSKIIIRGDYLLRQILPKEVLERVHREADKNGVEIIRHDSPKEFVGKDRIEKIISRNGIEIDCDLAILGVGLDLNTDIAAEAGLAMTEEGGILTDEFMRTSEPDIWAAGDIASYHDHSFKRRLRVERTESAKGQGQVAGADMAGAEVLPYLKVPFYAFNIFDLKIKVSGCFNPENLVRVGNPDHRAGYYSFENDILEGYLGFNRPSRENLEAKKLIPQNICRKDIIDYLEENGEAWAAI